MKMKYLILWGVLICFNPILILTGLLHLFFVNMYKPDSIL
jgi:hypothetical protein